MRKKEALRVLHKQLEELNGLKYGDNGQEWALRVTTFAQRLLQPGSIEFNRMQYMNLVGSNSKEFERYKDDCRLRMEHIIQTIQLHGVYRVHEPNWFSRQRTEVMVGLLTALIGGTYTVANWMGRQAGELELLRMEITLKAYQDSLRIYRTIPAHAALESDTVTSQVQSQSVEHKVPVDMPTQ